MRDELKFVIVGHVDHGKSTLIGRLLLDTGSLPEGKIEEIRAICESLGKELELGYVMDNLEEERDQGITIDTAQIFFKTAARDYVIIDAPGHVEFLKNMITGASQADAAVLIVDAREGIKEQTRRHAYLLDLLGIGRVIVAINKMDLVDYAQEHYEALKTSLSEILAGIDIAPLHYVPVSAKQGDNVVGRSPHMPWYSGKTLLEALDCIPSGTDANAKPLRFAVQDVYNFDRRICVGRVESGVLRVGDAVIVLPTGEETTVAAIEEFLRSPAEAEAGKAVGFTTASQVFVDRGFIVSRKGSAPEVTDKVRARIFWMDRLPGKKGDSLSFRCATQEAPCTLASIERVINSSTLEASSGDASEVKNKEVAEVILCMDRPIVVDEFYRMRELGRFVLCRVNPVAGGIVKEVIR